jgi:hypothetical protein
LKGNAVQTKRQALEGEAVAKGARGILMVMLSWMTRSSRGTRNESGNVQIARYFQLTSGWCLLGGQTSVDRDSQSLDQPRTVGGNG